MAENTFEWKVTREYRKEIIGEALRHYRVEKNMTQKEIADKVGVKLTTYNAYEKGVSEPCAEILVRLSIVLDISTDELLQRNKMDMKSSIDNLREFLQNYEELEKNATDPIAKKTLQEVRKAVQSQIDKLYSDQYKDTDISKLIIEELGLK